MAEVSQTYLDPKVLAKLPTLQLRARKIVDGYVSGVHRSPYRGFSVEFTEHREYAPGDDLRHVDWKVYGRSNKHYLKQYEEETNLMAYFMLDVSDSMNYQGPEAPMSKLDYARCLVAGLSYLIVRQHDSAGLLTFDHQLREFINPYAGAEHWAHLLRVMDGESGSEPSDFRAVFDVAAERLRNRGLVIVLSDLFDDIEKVTAGLSRLCHSRHDVIVFHLLDPAEATFPFQRTTMFKGMEQLADVIADARALRRAYLDELARHTQAIQSVCNRNRIDYFQVRTDQPIDEAMASFLGARMAKTK